jgi:methylated-DNA-[protein]-cysteine S-methyltransferase
MKKLRITSYKNDYCNLLLGSYDGKLCICNSYQSEKNHKVNNRIKKYCKSEYVEELDDVLQKSIKQLDEYFCKKRKEFDIPLLLIGTAFQKNVWNELLKIPYGKTISYKSLAKNCGDEKAFRAVANANGANALGIIIPCHRVIASDGTLGGYAGGLTMKQNLLHLESKQQC